MSRARTVSEDTPTTFVELFFDLGFVYAVTQVVHLFGETPTPASLGAAVVVFWLVWWVWTQFTWALNPADATHRFVRGVTLLATGLTFLLAVAVPGAYGVHALWFAGVYVLVRMLGLGLYLWLTVEDGQGRRAALRFGALSLLGMAAVVAGAALPEWQVPLWGGALVFDYAAARFSSRPDAWRVHPEHFAERHGLFVIIALGEVIVSAAQGLGDDAWSTPHLEVAFAAVGLACALWWTYFGSLRAHLTGALSRAVGASRTHLARDVFTLLHFPATFGIIVLAWVLDELVKHPEDAVEPTATALFGAGLALFVVGSGVAGWRATGRVPVARAAVVSLTAVGLGLAREPSPLLVLLVGGASAIATVALEARSDRDRSSG